MRRNHAERFRWSLVCAVIVLAAAACGYYAEIYRIYPGSEKSRNEIALLVEDSLYPYGIRTIDGDSFRSEKFAYRVDDNKEFKDVATIYPASPGETRSVIVFELSPGNHKILIGGKSIEGARTVIQGNGILDFTAVAGHVYWVEYAYRDESTQVDGLGRTTTSWTVVPKINDVTEKVKKKK